MTAHGQWFTDSISATLTETLESVATIPCGGLKKILVSLETSNNTALDQFVIQMKPHIDATFQDIYSTTTDFISPVGILEGTSGDLTNLAADSVGFFMMDVRGIYQINLKAAQSAGAATTLSIYFGGN